MKLRLYRTFIHRGVVAQLYADRELLCYTLDIPGKRGRSFIAGLPDGKFIVSKPGKPESEWQLQMTMPGSRKPLQLCLHDAMLPEELMGCEEPICLTSREGKVQLTESAMNTLLRIFKPVWSGEEKVYLVIESEGNRES